MSNDEVWKIPLSRRFFLSVAASIALVGCSDQEFSLNANRAKQARDLLGSSLFFIAHRGSGDNWTEHTARAYRNAIQLGAPAIEISVHRTSDGHFVCHHDVSLERLCGKDVLISSLSWDQLSEFRNDARAWLGPNTPQEMIPKLTDVLEELGGRAVLFIEDKTGQHTTELLDVLEASKVPVDSTVWKQSCAGSGYQEAAARGYATWGYFAPDDFHRIEELAERFDAVGIHDSADDTVLTRAVQTGKPVICWEVHSRSQTQRLQAHAIAGMMCSNYPYVSTDQGGAYARKDEFASGRRAAGDLPDRLTWSSQPAFLTDESALRISGQRKAAYIMGSMASLDTEPWVISAQVRWPEIGEKNQIAGIGFGLDSDEPYRAFEAGQTSGYHVQFETSGEVSLWKAQRDRPRLLQRSRVLRVTAGTWIAFSLHLSGTGMRVVADGRELFGVELPLAVPSGYLNLLNLIPDGKPIDFRSIELRSVA